MFLAFIVGGEIIFSLDKLIRGENKIEEDIVQESQELNELNCNKKLFLLGDSYTAGQGLPKGNRIADLIKFEDYCLINQSKGGDDWINYYKKYKKIIDSSNPGDIVIIGVNWNDILYSNQEFTNKDKISNKSKTVDKKRINKPQVKKKKAWYRELYTSSILANTLSSNIQNTLKRHDLALPIGEFHYLNKIGYKEKKVQLDEFLFTIDSLNKKNGIKSIIYLMPVFNLLNNNRYFEQYINYYTNKNLNTISIMNGFNDFNKEEGQDYMLSIHDGHPNSKAHAVISKSIMVQLSKQSSRTNP